MNYTTLLKGYVVSADRMLLVSALQELSFATAAFCLVLHDLAREVDRR